MIKKGMVWAVVPFVAGEQTAFQTDFAKKAAEQGWEQTKMQGNLLLKHINTTLAKNVACFVRQFGDGKLEIPCADPRDKTVMHHYAFVIDRVQICCFDTGIGFCCLHIPYDTETQEDVIVNSCYVLHNSARQTDPDKGRIILQNKKETHLSCIAEELLTELFGTVTLFGTQSDEMIRRINLFSAVLCDIPKEPETAQRYDVRCYQLANAHDTRDEKLVIDKEKLHYPRHYIRWGFSKRGCAFVANQTGEQANDSFLEHAWFKSINSNYFFLYLMVLHEKYASYYYLNQIADDPNMDRWKINQRALTEFNAKYIFTVVSDEPLIQSAYEKMKKAANADEVYTELQEQLRGMFDYARIKSDEVNERTNRKLNLISVIVTAVCSISVIFDTSSLFVGWGWTFGFLTVRDCVFTGVILLEVLLFLVVLILVVAANKKPKNKNK